MQWPAGRSHCFNARLSGSIRARAHLKAPGHVRKAWGDVRKAWGHVQPAAVVRAAARVVVMAMVRAGARVVVMATATVVARVVVMEMVRAAARGLEVSRVGRGSEVVGRAAGQGGLASWAARGLVVGEERLGARGLAVVVRSAVGGLVVMAGSCHGCHTGAHRSGEVAEGWLCWRVRSWVFSGGTRGWVPRGRQEVPLGELALLLAASLQEQKRKATHMNSPLGQGASLHWRIRNGRACEDGRCWDAAA